MSQYLSHLANLTFNRLDVVQPRLSSRFESQDAGIAPGLNEQTFYESDASPINPVPQTPAFTGEPSTHEPHSELVNKAPKPAQTLSSEPKLSLRAETQVSFNPDHQKPSPQPYEPKLPALQSAKTALRASTTNTPSLKEEVIETHLPLLQPIKLASAVGQKNYQSQQDSAFSSPITAKIENSPPETSRGTEPKKVGQEQSAQATELTTKPASIKPESIRVKSLEPEFFRGAPAAKQSLVSATVDITPPSIHVSIGRIEIRAHQTNAQTTAKSRQPSTMSLDDYAKRNGERS